MKLRIACQRKHKMYAGVPQGFERYYPPDVVLLLLKTLYGTKQAAIQFWKWLCAVSKLMGFYRSKADCCLYYNWTYLGLVVFLSWVDDMMVCGKYEAVQLAKEQFKKHVDTDEQGE